MFKKDALNLNHLFGTDGIRGTPGKYPLTPHMLARIAYGLADYLVFNPGLRPQRKPRVIIGRDTRLSGKKIESFLVDAFVSHSVDVYLCGAITTPGLSVLVRKYNCSLGVMISASHNKPTDNGIKIFNSQGQKLNSQQEKAIEEIVFNQTVPTKPKGSAKSITLKDSHHCYVEFLASTVKGLNLKGVKICLDCAFGAASPFAREVFHRLGATVYSIHDKPSGRHINKGGAINPVRLQKLVIKTKADIGVALDGDGDRGVLIAENGLILDGDYILTIMADYLKSQNLLNKDTVVTTVMSNFGLRSFLASIGVKTIITDVGDKYVLDALLRYGLNLGGEQSGHIIFKDYSFAPDGLLTSLQLLKVMKATGKKLSELAQKMRKFPQILLNIKVKEKRPFESFLTLQERLKYFNRQLENQGRILLRYSGTEPLARVMVEGKDEDMITSIANTLAEHIKREIGQN